MATSAQKAFQKRQDALIKGGKAKSKASAAKKGPKKPSAKERAARGGFAESKADGGWGADYRRNMRQAKFLAEPIVPTASGAASAEKSLMKASKDLGLKPKRKPVITAKTDAQQAALGIPRLKKREKTITDLTNSIR